jgi:hypothetical protein
VRVRLVAGETDENRIYPAGRSLPVGSLGELSRVAEILDLIWLAGEIPLRVERRGGDGERLLLWEHQGLCEDH